MRSETASAAVRLLGTPPAGKTGNGYRHELKYRISTAEKAALEEK